MNPKLPTFYKIIPILAAILFAAPVFAHRVNPEGLFRRVTYECPEDSVFVAGFEEYFSPDQNFTKKMKLFFEATILRGLQRLSGINGELAQKAEKALLENDLIVSCKAPPNSPIAAFQRGGWWSDSKIYLGSAAWAVYSLHKKYGPPIGDYIHFVEQRTDEGISFNLSTTFHEFLHFTAIDNLPTAQHNSLHIYNLQFWDDLVYSCTNAVYGNSEWFKSAEERRLALTKCKTGQ